MAEMEFKYTIQQYQTDAVNSVVRVFAGQPYNDKFNYRMDVGSNFSINGSLLDPRFDDDSFYTGFSNSPILLNDEQLLKNVNDVQIENNVKESKSLDKQMNVPSLDVEMETGTGKTYVYIKTMFELNRQYGWSKFIVVVPSYTLPFEVVPFTSPPFIIIWGTSNADLVSL